MRIAFAYDSAYPWVNGGIEKRRYLIMQKLVEKGHEVHLFTMFREGMPGDEFRYNGVSYHCVGKALPTGRMYVHGRRNMRWPLKYALLLRLKIIRHRFDLIDADAFPFLHLEPLFVYAKLSGAKFVVTWHEVWSREYWKKYLGNLGDAGYVTEKFAASSAKVMIANTEETKRELTKIFKVASDRVLVFPAAISGDEIRGFLRKRRLKREQKFIVVARMIPEKRVDLAIRAVAETKAKLVIVAGVGEERPRLEEIARRLGIAKRVRFLENISTDALFTQICTSKAMLMLSEREGLSLTSLESLALGTPVITIGSTVVPTEIKRLTTVVDDGKLGDFLNDFLKKGKEVGPKIRSRVLRDFSADESDAFYRKLAGES